MDLNDSEHIHQILKDFHNKNLILWYLFYVTVFGNVIKHSMHHFALIRNTMILQYLYSCCQE